MLWILLGADTTNFSAIPVYPLFHPLKFRLFPHACRQQSVSIILPLPSPIWFPSVITKLQYKEYRKIVYAFPVALPSAFPNMAFVIYVQNILTNMAPKNAWQSCHSSRHHSPGPRPLALAHEPGPRTVGRAPGPHSRARARAPGSGCRASAPVPVPEINMLYCNCPNVL